MLSIVVNVSAFECFDVSFQIAKRARVPSPDISRRNRMTAEFNPLCDSFFT